MKCALCGGDIFEKDVTEEIVVGNKHLVLKVKAEVCGNCHERYYASGVVDKLIKVKEDFEGEQSEVTSYWRSL
ncbi:MAG: YgiT-type zinc finger protein [Elusimicrobiota bacterium]